MTETITSDFLFANWADLSWRHHGAGLLQANVSKTQRIHIWHPDLLIEGMAEGGAMHNHRFGLLSEVLVGTLFSKRITETTLPSRHHWGGGVFRTFAVWQIPMASRGTSEQMRRVGAQLFHVGEEERFSAGSRYFLPKWAYHHAYSKGLAITAVVRQQFEAEGEACLLAHVDHRPVHAFGHVADLELVSRVLRLAHGMLR